MRHRKLGDGGRSPILSRELTLRPFRHLCFRRLGEFGIDGKLIGDDGLRNESEKGRTTMAKAGLYTLCFVILFGVLLIGAGFVIWDAVHDQPEPLPALRS
jgi:hypothetical protein